MQRARELRTLISTWDVSSNLSPQGSGDPLEEEVERVWSRGYGGHQGNHPNQQDQRTDELTERGRRHGPSGVCPRRVLEPKGEEGI